MARRPGSHGPTTRQAILRVAADVASVDGLEALSIGRLATELTMSKSGLFAHFGSKEALQLATVEDARQRYVHEVVQPGLRAPAGIVRLHALCESFLSYVERAVFPGGCFFASAMAEFDGRADGPVRDLVVECQDQWMQTLERAARDALAHGHLRADTDAAQLAFDLEAALLSGNWYFHLHRDASYLARARQGVRSRLLAAATRAGVRALPDQ